MTGRLVGGRVGAEALKVLLSLSVAAGLAGAAGRRRSQVLKIKRRVPRPERVAKAPRDRRQGRRRRLDRTEWTFAKETCCWTGWCGKEPVVAGRSAGDPDRPAVFLSCPAEYFCQFGLDIRAGQQVPADVSGVAGQRLRRLRADRRSPRPARRRLRNPARRSYSNLEPTAGRQIADDLIEMANQLTPGEVPPGPPLPPFKGSAWSYGTPAGIGLSAARKPGAGPTICRLKTVHFAARAGPARCSAANHLRRGSRSC